MSTTAPTYQELCAAVACGSPGARQQFRSALLPCLRAIVRRSLRTGSPPGEWGPGRPAAGARGFTASPSGSGDRLVDRLARQLCDSLVAAIERARPPTWETVAHQWGHKTVTRGLNGDAAVGPSGRPA